MRRYHVFELEDLSWWPQRFRDYQTDFLRDFLGLLGVYRSAIPILAGLISGPAHPRIVDLCSGAAGPWTRLIRDLPESASVVLTDLYPNEPALERASQHPQLDFISAPVDATRVDRQLVGVRTIFTAFHHLTPSVAQSVLADAARARQPIAVFEIVQRRWLNILLMPLVVLSVLFLTPFIHPRCPWRLFWTYLIPVAPLSIFWDGLVSQLRAYHPHELLSMAQDAEPDFRWEVGQCPIILGLNLTYLVGTP